MGPADLGRLMVTGLQRLCLLTNGALSFYCFFVQPGPGCHERSAFSDISLLHRGWAQVTPSSLPYRRPGWEWASACKEGACLPKNTGSSFSLHLSREEERF